MSPVHRRMTEIATKGGVNKDAVFGTISATGDLGRPRDRAAPSGYGHPSSGILCNASDVGIDLPDKLLDFHSCLSSFEHPYTEGLSRKTALSQPDFLSEAYGFVLRLQLVFQSGSGSCIWPRRLPRMVPEDPNDLCVAAPQCPLKASPATPPHDSFELILPIFNAVNRCRLEIAPFRFLDSLRCQVQVQVQDRRRWRDSGRVLMPVDLMSAQFLQQPLSVQGVDSECGTAVDGGNRNRVTVSRQRRQHDRRECQIEKAFGDR